MKKMTDETKKKIGNSNRLSKDEFFKRLHAKYDGVYSLEKVNYTTLNDYVTLICPKHGEFTILAKTAISKEKQGKCPICAKEYRAELSSKRQKGKIIVSTEEFIRRGNEKYNFKYDYSKVDMEHKREDGKVCIICHELDEFGNEHGEFWQKPNQHLFGKSCPKCGNRKKSTKYILDKFREVNGDTYDYSLVKYDGMFKKVEVICTRCGEHFFVTPHNHIKGRGCPRCKKSKLEIDMIKFLSEHNIAFNEQQKFDWLINENGNQQKLDFFLPDYNVAIECQGLQHFMSVKIFGGDEKLLNNLKNDKNKFFLCKEHNIKLMYYSNLGITYPYTVYENKDELLGEIISNKP